MKKKFNLLQLKLTYFVLLGLSGIFCMSGIKDIQVMKSLEHEKATNEALRDQMDDQIADLEQRRRNLTNPDYLEFMARGKYHVSCEGEQVFVFPSMGNEEE